MRRGQAGAQTSADEAQLLKILNALLTKYVETLRAINAEFEAQNDGTPLVERLLSLLELLEKLREKEKIMTQPMRNLLNKTEDDAKTLLLRVCEAILEKAEAEYEALHNQFSDLMNPYSYDHSDEMALLQFTGLGPLMKAVDDVIGIVAKAKDNMPPALASRVLRLEIKSSAQLVRFELMTTARTEAKCLSIATQMKMLSRVKQFEDAYDGFESRQDAHCMRALYYFYELQMSILPPGYFSPSSSGFDPRKVLEKLAMRSAPSLTQMMALQSHMLEALYYVSGAEKKEKGDFAAIVKYRKKILEAHASVVSNPDHLGNISLAKAHFVAFRYDLVYHHYHLCGQHKHPLNFLVDRDRNGEWETIEMIPKFQPDFVTSSMLQEFMEKERASRKQYFLPYVELLEGLDFDCVPMDVPLQSLLQSIVLEGLNHAVKMSEQMKLLFDLFTNNKLSLTTTCANHLKDFCQEWLALCQRFKMVNEDYNKKNLDRMVRGVSDNQKRRFLIQVFKFAREKVAEKSEEMVNGLAETLRKQKKQQDELEKKTEQAAKEINEAAESSYKKDKKARESRVAALAAQHEAWATAQQLRREKARKAREAADKAEEKREDMVEPEVKSAAHQQLEQCDLETDQLACDLLERVKYIDRVLQSKLTTKALLNHETMTTFDQMLKSSLADYQTLLTLHGRYVALATSLSTEDEVKVRAGLAMSIPYIESLEDQICDLLGSSSALLEKVTERAEESKKKFIASLGEKEATKKELIDLTPEEIFSLGWERFREIGREKRARGEEISDYTLERQFLNAIMKVYYPSLQALRHPKVAMAAHIHHDPRVFRKGAQTLIEQPAPNQTPTASI